MKNEKEEKTELGSDNFVIYYIDDMVIVTTIEREPQLLADWFITIGDDVGHKIEDFKRIVSNREYEPGVIISNSFNFQFVND